MRLSVSSPEPEAVGNGGEKRDTQREAKKNRAGIRCSAQSIIHHFVSCTRGRNTASALGVRLESDAQGINDPGRCLGEVIVLVFEPVGLMHEPKIRLQVNIAVATEAEGARVGEDFQVAVCTGVVEQAF